MLFIKPPEQTSLGRYILSEGTRLLNEIGYDQFTFKKLAERINTKEPSIYRYFENKQQLLLYLISTVWDNINQQIKEIPDHIETELKIKSLCSALALNHLDTKSDLKVLYKSQGLRVLLPGSSARQQTSYKLLVGSINAVFASINPRGANHDNFAGEILDHSIIENSRESLLGDKIIASTETFLNKMISVSIKK